jgi:hypothetical protein
LVLGVKKHAESDGAIILTLIFSWHRPFKKEIKDVVFLHKLTSGCWQ